MIAALLTLLLFAGPYWEAKAPADWTPEEINELLTNSPWAQNVTGTGIGRLPPIHMYLATASPILAAEAERKRRAELEPKPPPDPEARPEPVDTEYQDWLAANRATQLILAVRIEDTYAFNNAKEAERFEKDAVLRVGRRKVQMTGYFPPSAADPYVRIAFPRDGIRLDDKELRFELYVPGITGPFRVVEFRLADMSAGGRLEL